MDVFKDELRKNRECAENVKQLQGGVDKFQDSEAMKKVKDAYERAGVCLCPPILYSKPDSIGLSLQLASSIKEDPKLRAAAQELRKASVQVGDAVSETLKSMEESGLCVLCVSERLSSISSPQPYNIRVDLTPPLACLQQ